MILGVRMGSHKTSDRQFVPHSSRERRETSRNGENGSSIESAGQRPNSAIAAGCEGGPENPLKVETRVRNPVTSGRDAPNFEDDVIHLRSHTLVPDAPRRKGRRLLAADNRFQMTINPRLS
jgi:hypothetical protein